jgi:hypothetical protein
VAYTGFFFSGGGGVSPVIFFVGGRGLHREFFCGGITTGIVGCGAG